MTTDLPDAAKPDHLTDTLRRHGVLSAGRVRDVTTDGPRDTLKSRIVRLKLAYEGAAEKAPASLILKTWRPRDGVPEAWAAREVLFYDTVAPATPAGPLLRCFDAGQSPRDQGLAPASGGRHRQPPHRHRMAITAHRAAVPCHRWRAGALPRRVVGREPRAVGAEPDMAMVRDLYQRVTGFLGQPLRSPGRSAVGRPAPDLRALLRGASALRPHGHRART